MDVNSPNRLSDHCRTRGDSELARRRRRPFSGSDKYLEYKQRAEPLMGECLSFVFVTLCDRDLQRHSLRCVVMCACVFVSVHARTHEWETETSQNHISTLSKVLCCGTTTVLHQNLRMIESKVSKGWWGSDLPGMCLLINQPGWLRCTATTLHKTRLSLGEPRTDTTRPFVAATGMECDLE